MTLELTLEQEFLVQSFKAKVQGLDREQALDFMVKLYIQMLAQETAYKKLLKYQWGIEK